ncbi:hypothetical protein P4O66_008773, partial [Electrophorus voltai]
MTPDPAPVYDTPDDMTPDPAPVHDPPDDMTPDPAPVHDTPDDMTPDPAPVHDTPDDMTPDPAPVHDTPDDMTPDPAPVHDTPDDMTPDPAVTWRSLSPQEHPRGSLPPRLWADPTSLTGGSAEGKGFELPLSPLEIPILHPTTLSLVGVVPLIPPRPRLNSLPFPERSRSSPNVLGSSQHCR